MTTYGLKQMNKYLSKQLKDQLDLPSSVFKQIPRLFIQGIEDALRRGDKVRFDRLCIIEPVFKKQRQGRNPVTGESVTIPAFIGVKYKTSQEIINRLNEKDETNS